MQGLWPKDTKSCLFLKEFTLLIYWIIVIYMLFKGRLVNGSYPNLLKKAGYNIAFIGKYGVGHHTYFLVYDYVYNSEAGGKWQPDYFTVGKKSMKIHDTDTIYSAIQYFLDQYGKKWSFCISVSFKAQNELDGNSPVYPIQQKLLSFNHRCWQSNRKYKDKIKISGCKILTLK